MKIISTDNLARETVAEHLVIASIPNTPANDIMAKQICDWLNTFTCDDNGGRFHKVVSNDYRLSRGMEDLI